MTSPTESPDVEAVVAGLRELQHELRADEFVTRWPKATGLIYQAISLLEGVRRPTQPPPDIAHLLKFYNVETVEEVVRIQSLHIQRLQSKLPPARDEQPRNYREG